MNVSPKQRFDSQYQLLLKHLVLKGMQPKTVDAYSRAVRRAGARFEHQIDALSVAQLTDYFSELVQTHSWNTVRLELYGLKFYYRYVLQKPWAAPGLVEPPKCKRLPNVITVAQVQQIVAATRVLSYRVFFFTLYSLGLRLGEGLRLRLSDIDAARERVHIRHAKGNKDRFVHLPHNTLLLLRRFWQTHRNPTFLFPNRKAGLKGASSAKTPLDRAGVQMALKKVVQSCGLKKRFHRTTYATAMPRT